MIFAVQPVAAGRNGPGDWMRKMKVNIIGAGTAGLCAGCYLQMKGFETEIFESRHKAGGLCTSWKKGDYTFDGCIHWMMGSAGGNPFYRLWSELIDLDSMQFVNHELRADIELKYNRDKDGGRIFHLYTNLDRLEKYMCEQAPADRKRIAQFIGSARLAQQFEMPPMIEEAAPLLSFKDKLRYVKHLPLLLFLVRWRNVTNYTFAAKLKSPFLKEAFQLLFDEDEAPLLFLSIPLSYFDSKSAGYPIGGSSALINKIEEKYRSLGGRIRFNSRVAEIITENNSAAGVALQDGMRFRSDITVSASDCRSSIFEALGGRYVNKAILRMNDEKKCPVFYSLFRVSLGVRRSFEAQPHLIRFPIPDDLVSPDGTAYRRMELHTYNYDGAYAPEGKTVLSVSLYTKKSDFWIGLRKARPDEYAKCKQGFADRIIDALDRRFGNIKANIEEIDVATPATFHRKTGNWKGSLQGWDPGKRLFSSPPVGLELPGLSNFYFCGHWTAPGGGLPIALKSARDVAKIICSRCNVKF